MSFIRDLDQYGEYAQTTGERVSVRGADGLRLYADEQMRQIRRIGVPLAAEAGLKVERPDSLGALLGANDLVPVRRIIRADTFLRGGELADGAKSNVLALQKALAYAKKYGVALDLRGGKWLIDKLDALTLHSDALLLIEGAELIGSPLLTTKGSLFLAPGVDNVRWVGRGVFKGQKAVWNAPLAGQSADLGPVNNRGTLIRAITYSGAFSRIRHDGGVFRDFTSNATAFLGTAGARGSDVQLNGVEYVNNSSYYYDYVEAVQPALYGGAGGPQIGAVEGDKGQYGIYYVDRYAMIGCIVRDNDGDNGHILDSKKGVISGAVHLNNKMGGLFLEACEDATITGHLLHNNGSRTITIEARSKRINVVGGIMSYGGREGIWGWGWDSGACVGNVFYLNGQKGVAGLNANLLLASYKAADTTTIYPCDVTVDGNYFETHAAQEYQIRVVSQLSGVNITSSNIFRGPVRKIRVDAWLSQKGTVRVGDVDGWKTTNRGSTTITGDGATTTFDVPHGLDFSDPGDSRMLDVVKVWTDLRPRNAAAATAQAFVKRTTQPQGGCTKLEVQLPVAPANGAVLEFDWLAEIR